MNQRTTEEISNRAAGGPSPELALAPSTETCLPADAAGRNLKHKGWLASLLLRRSAAQPLFPLFYQRLNVRWRRVRRRLGRKWAAAVIGAALLFSSVQIPAAHAATITVDGKRCTLANAIRAANTDSAVGRCRAGSGADIIELRKNVALTAPAGYYYYSPTGLPLVTSQITIQGNGHTIRRALADPDQFRLLAVSATGDLTVNDAMLSGGYAVHPYSFVGGGGVHNSGVLTINNSAITGNRSSVYGGGIYTYIGSTTTITNSTITSNSAYKGGGVASYRGSLTVTDSTISGNSGSGVYNSGVLTITNSTISGNTAGRGGGINNRNGILTITNSTISGNSAGDGGGVYNSGGLTINSSDISGNSANSGGGVHNRSGTTTINSSDISGNSAGFGGGINNRYGTTTITNGTITSNSAYVGGGISAFYAATTITDSTISNNTAGGSGGGIRIYDSDLTIANSTISGNSAGGNGGGIATIEDYSDLTITNSTISGNTAGRGGGVFIHEGETTIINSTLTSNTADLTGGGLHNDANLDGTVTLSRTLISGNAAPTGREINGGNTVNADDYNLFGLLGDAGGFDFTPGPTDIVPAGPLDAILTPTLADNGGPTPTHALVPGSPAIDVAPNADCAAAPINGRDQRGEPRNVDGNGIPSSNECDVGSFEFAP